MLTEGTLLIWKKDRSLLTLLVGMPTGTHPDLYWVKIAQSDHPKYRRGMTFIFDVTKGKQV